MPRENNNKGKIEVYGNELKTTYLRSQVADMIMKGKDKNTIVNWLMDTYNMPFKNAISMHRQGYVFIYLYAEQTKDEIKQLNLARLEELWQMAEKDAGLSGKDYYSVQMKNVEMVNRTAGIYDKEQNEDKSGDINFNLNIGGSNTVETNYEEVNEDETN